MNCWGLIEQHNRPKPKSCLGHLDDGENSSETVPRREAFLSKVRLANNEITPNMHVLSAHFFGRGEPDMLGEEGDFSTNEKNGGGYFSTFSVPKALQRKCFSDFVEKLLLRNTLKSKVWVYTVWKKISNFFLEKLFLKTAIKSKN